MPIYATDSDLISIPIKHKGMPRDEPIRVAGITRFLIFNGK